MLWHWTTESDGEKRTPGGEKVRQPVLEEPAQSQPLALELGNSMGHKGSELRSPDAHVGLAAHDRVSALEACVAELRAVTEEQARELAAQRMLLRSLYSANAAAAAVLAEVDTADRVSLPSSAGCACRD